MMYYANARSLRNKTIALEMLLSYANYDVLSIAETYLSDSDSSANCLVGSEGTYDMFRCDRDNRKGGGVTIFCKRVLNPVRLNFPENLCAVEAVCIELTVASRQRILCVYRPPNCSNYYNENMCELISHCSRNMTNVIILGSIGQTMFRPALSSTIHSMNALVKTLSLNTSIFQLVVRIR